MVSTCRCRGGCAPWTVRRSIVSRQTTSPRFFANEYVVAAADRMGMRLRGAKLNHAQGHDIISEAIAPGSIQISGAGEPIVLLADRQTTGGYPKIATVISADLPALGRLPTG